MTFGEGGTRGARRLPSRTLQPCVGATQAAKQARTPPSTTTTPRALQGKRGKAGSCDEGRFMPGAGSCLSFRDFVCQHCGLRSPGPQGCPRRHRGFSALGSSALAASAALLSRSPRSSSLAWLPSPPAKDPVPSSLPQDTSAFPPPHPAGIQHFPPALDVCPQDLHAQKLKLPMSGNDYALSVQIAEWKGRKHPPGAVSRGKSRGAGAQRCPHRRLPWGWRQTPLRSTQSAAGEVAFPLSLPSTEEGRVAGSPLPCRAPQVLYPPSSLRQIPNGNQQHIQG